jgi:hypothetical protein
MNCTSSDLQLPDNAGGDDLGAHNGDVLVSCERRVGESVREDSRGDVRDFHKGGARGRDFSDAGAGEDLGTLRRRHERGFQRRERKPRPMRRGKLK